jgi:hypothetical protein
MISIHAGRVISWATCLVPVDQMDRLLRSMRHLGSIRVAGDDSAGREGRSVWIGSFDGHPIGLSWQWGEVRRGVLALSDPMAIESNIGFIGPAGSALGEGVRTLHLNALVHALDWQATADRATAARGAFGHESQVEPLAA